MGALQYACGCERERVCSSARVGGCIDARVRVFRGAAPQRMCVCVRERERANVLCSPVWRGARVCSSTKPIDRLQIREPQTELINLVHATDADAAACIRVCSWGVVRSRSGSCFGGWFRGVAHERGSGGGGRGAHVRSLPTPLGRGHAGVELLIPVTASCATSPLSNRVTAACGHPSSLLASGMRVRTFRVPLPGLLVHPKP